MAQVGERLQVTPGQWAEWTAEAKATAAARKGDPDQLGFQKRLRDALAAAEAKGGRARRGERSQAAEQAQQAAQRRDADPMERRRKLVQQLGYLTFKRAALVALYVQAGLGGEDAMQARVQKQNSQQVTSALLGGGAAAGGGVRVSGCSVRHEAREAGDKAGAGGAGAEAPRAGAGTAGGRGNTAAGRVSTAAAAATQQQEEAAPTSNYALRARSAGEKS